MAKFLIIFSVLHLGSGQFTDFLDPIAKVSRDIAGGIASNPFLSEATHASTNALAAAVTSVSWLPFAAANAFGAATIPSLSSITNNPDIVDRLVLDLSHLSQNEDAKLSIDMMLSKYGLPVEIHEVETEDGFILTIYRIPGNSTPVFLMHGLLGSADDFVVAGRESALSYLLAEEGYDVWLGNARGSKHSRRHINLEPFQAEFWDFSWHEIGVYDLPAMIDYVLNETGNESLKYIGHSQGTTSFFVMASERPEYNEKIGLMVALSPVAFMANARSPIVRLIAPGTSLIHGFAKSLGVYEFLPDNNMIRTLKLLICGTGVLAELLCSNTLFLTAGFDLQQLNITNLSTIFGHVPSGASTKQIAHYGQSFISNEFRQFDYGRSGNLKRYGQFEPPKYVLKRIVAPVSLFFSESDWLAHPADVDRLSKSLGNVVDIYKVPFKQFNHVDFFLAKDVKELVYNRLLKVLSSF